METGEALRFARAGLLLEQAAIDGGRLRESFSEVADLLGGGMFQLINVTDPRAPELVVAPSCEGVQRDYIINGWHEADIWTHKATAVAKPGQLLQTELVPAEIRKRNAFFNEFCRNWNIGRFDAWTFDLCGEKWGYTYMSAEASPPTETGVKLLHSLMPAANRAALLASIVQDALAEGFTRGLDHAGRACFILNHLGRVEHASRAAEALIGRGFVVRQGELRGIDPSSEAELQRLAKLARLSRPPTLRNFLIHGPDGRRPLLAMPVSLRDRQLDGLPGARIVLMLADLEPPAELDASRLRGLFQLTPRECDLAARIAIGERIDEAADRLGVSVLTARHMLKSIFAKTNTHRQAELAVLLSRALE